MPLAFATSTQNKKKSKKKTPFKKISYSGSLIINRQIKRRQRRHRRQQQQNAGWNRERFKCEHWASLTNNNKKKEENVTNKKEIRIKNISLGFCFLPFAHTIDMDAVCLYIYSYMWWIQWQARCYYMDHNAPYCIVYERILCQYCFVFFFILILVLHSFSCVQNI